MDQLRTALVWLKRHHFWVLCGLVAIIAFGSWAKASGKLSALFTTNQTAIKNEFTNVQGLRKDPFHPNEDVNTKQQAQTKQQAADVAKLWQATLRPAARARARVAAGAEQGFSRLRRQAAIRRRNSLRPAQPLSELHRESLSDAAEANRRPRHRPRHRGRRSRRRIRPRRSGRSRGRRRRTSCKTRTTTFVCGRRPTRPSSATS